MGCWRVRIIIGRTRKCSHASDEKTRQRNADSWSDVTCQWSSSSTEPDEGESVPNRQRKLFGGHSAPHDDRIVGDRGGEGGSPVCRLEWRSQTRESTTLGPGQGQFASPDFPVFGGAEMIRNPIGRSLPLWFMIGFKPYRMGKKKESSGACC